MPEAASLVTESTFLYAPFNELAWLADALAPGPAMFMGNRLEGWLNG